MSRWAHSAESRTAIAILPQSLRAEPFFSKQRCTLSLSRLSLPRLPLPRLTLPRLSAHASASRHRFTPALHASASRHRFTPALHAIASRHRFTPSLHASQIGEAPQGATQNKTQKLNLSLYG
ncbi:MAG: hypothetical protein MH252_03240 [Thermosynechococcaceae cyanobacterium MS004]|nr:hypothetical protein [Thermosynechococcaceae cyanobacterium MS004]